MNYVVPGPHVFVVPRGKKIKKTKESSDNKEFLDLISSVMENQDLHSPVYFDLIECEEKEL